jgi:hypothetical protein
MKKREHHRSPATSYYKSLRHLRLLTTQKLAFNGENGWKKIESEKFATSVAKHLQLFFLCSVFCFLLLLLGFLVFFPPSFLGDCKGKNKKKQNTKKQKHKSLTSL